MRERQLADHISVALLLHAFPPERVDAAVTSAGRQEQRRRLLPAHLVVYYVLAMALFADSSSDEVLRRLLDGLSWASGWRREWAVPTKVAISKARERLGPEPLRILFETVCVPRGNAETGDALWRGFRVLGLGATCLDVAHTPQNDAVFRRPGSSRREGAKVSPQLRLAASYESTGAIVGAALGPFATSEGELVSRLLEAFGPHTVCIAGETPSLERFAEASAHGGELVCAAASDLELPREQTLPDGSYLTAVPAALGARVRGGCDRVRVVECALQTSRAGADANGRLLTTMLDPRAAPASELAALSAMRPELDDVLDQLNADRGRAPRVFRSKRPEGVYQEAYGYLCAHHAIRRLVDGAAQATAAQARKGDVSSPIATPLARTVAADIDR